MGHRPHESRNTNANDTQSIRHTATRTTTPPAYHSPRGAHQDRPALLLPTAVDAPLQFC